jgi:hypothetical protein
MYGKIVVIAPSRMETSKNIYWESGYIDFESFKLPQSHDRYGIGMVNENKFSFVSGSNYKLRKKIIDEFIRNRHSFKLAGRNWDRSRTWHLKKQVTDKQNELNSINTTTSVQETKLRLRAQGYGYYLSESEVQQAQVVLAAQDMVDKMQDMIEDSTEMQFKELPALVDSIKNQIGANQAAQFNNDAQAALSGLVQNLQSSKQQLEQALGVVTGQGPVEMPGGDAGMPPPEGDMGLAGPAPGEEEVEIAAVEPGAAAPAAALGRERR